jgi:hypothetical protein
MQDFKHVTPEYMAANKAADRIIGWMAFVGLIVLLGTDLLERLTG